ncbi:MAG: penicillin-binding transpeptidase domain-containing protein, partial [Acidimicrobiia bacterium]|nr:penicillin-binding transpeptidase domain-containing protein [Acidimicrobiia bacterium]
QPAEVQNEIQAITAGLGRYMMTAAAGSVVAEDEYRATAPTTLQWTLDDGTMFTTAGRLRLVRVGEDWQIDWDPGVIHDGLAPGDVLVRERVTSPRAPILGAGGFELVGYRPVIQIGVVPRNVPDSGVLADRLAQLFGVDAADIGDLIRRSPSGEVLTLVERRVEVVEPLRAELTTLPGVVLVEAEAMLTPYEGYGRALLGWAGEVTAEILEQSPEYFEVGDIVGRSGLQAAYNEQLAGLPGFRVRIERRFPLRDQSGQEIPADADVNTVYLSAPPPPEALRTTIDHDTQVAAERALAETQLPSALVAVRASTGEVLAVANGPGAAVQNNALTGQFPPGSILKIVTAYAALAQGATPDEQVSCPPATVVDGKEFRNSDGHGFGDVTVRRAFAESCNTTFIQLGLRLDPPTLPGVARLLGVGADYNLGTPAFSGSVPTPGSPVDQAATAFGQGQVLVSPLSMAVMSASVAAGSFNPPVLVTDRAIPGAGQALAPVVVDQLRQMMADVVNGGTGRAAAAPGGQVFGKTGTAEFGNDQPPVTHAWFVGFQGDVAFAVLIEGGGFGGSVAAPIAARFLSLMADQG